MVQKGDRVRCRLVAQEFAGKDKREDLYAGAPPLAATRYVLSGCVSRGVRRTSTRKLMVLDIKKCILLRGGNAQGLCGTPSRRRQPRHGRIVSQIIVWHAGRSLQLVPFILEGVGWPRVRKMRIKPLQFLARRQEGGMDRTW